MFRNICTPYFSWGKRERISLFQCSVILKENDSWIYGREPEVSRKILGPSRPIPWLVFVNHRASQLTLPALLPQPLKQRCGEADAVAADASNRKTDTHQGGRGRGQDRARELPLSQKRPENMSTDEGDTVRTPLC